MILIEIRNSDGCVGRCDAKCYDAEGGRCSCICQGANHGVGATQAVRNARTIHADWTARVLDVAEGATVAGHPILNQLELFDDA